MSKIVENNRNLLKDALLEYNAIKEEAINVAKNRLAKSMPDVIEKFLKEELEKSMGEGVISTEQSMINDQESSIAGTMKDIESPVSESDDMDDEEMDMEDDDSEDMDDDLTAKAIEDALKEMEDMDVNEDMYQEDMYKEDEDMYEEDQEFELDLNEHDPSFKFDLKGDKFSITDIKIDDQSFDDIELELELDSDDMDSEDEDMDDMDMDSEDMDMEDMGSEDMSDDDMDMDNMDFDSLEDEDEEVVEAKVRTFAHKRTQAGKLGSTKSDQKLLRPAMQESAMKKDINKLIKENQELKSINVEFKNALKKYKTQLYEMAVFNANLSHVNNLFVEHTTTVNEKKEILTKFKSVSTIDESKNVYKGFIKTLNESKPSKKTIEEIVEKPSSGGSGSQKLNESLNKQNDIEGVKAIKYMMNYIENKRK